MSFSIVHALLRLPQGAPLPEPEPQPEEPGPPPKPAGPPAIWIAGHAYTPNEQATYGGNDHLLLLVAFDAGRLHRKPGDPLCTTRRFWGLSPFSPGDKRAGDPTCTRCREMAKRYGFDLTDRFKPAPGCGPTTTGEPTAARHENEMRGAA